MARDAVGLASSCELGLCALYQWSFMALTKDDRKKKGNDDRHVMQSLRLPLLKEEAELLDIQTQGQRSSSEEGTMKASGEGERECVVVGRSSSSGRRSSSGDRQQQQWLPTMR
ncbi:hypothetical protein Ancab_035866, partial [Ancistrocladus abbreviatus]